jgi:hypothetical protein
MANINTDVKLLSSDEILDKRLNATPKQHLFGNLILLEELIRRVKDPELQIMMQHRIEGAMSWEPLIYD